MRDSVRLSFELGVCVLGIAILAAGCQGGRRRGNGPDPLPMTDGGGRSDGGPGEVDLGPAPDGDVPLPGCGNGTVDAGEECDDAGPSETCDSDCTFAICGDYMVNTARGEQCDDGNMFSEDGCSSACLFETPASCGDRTVNGGEQCDAGPTGSSTCDADCTFATCGDLTLNTAAGEQCDSGGTATSECDADCTFSVCGDGVINPYTEVCDDGGTSSGDGCSAGSCSVESGWTCSGAPSYCVRMGGGTIDRTATPGLSIPDNSLTGVSSNISITGATATSCSIASITVDVNITHTYIGDLSVTLTSPGLAAVELHANSGSGTDNIIGTYPTTLTPAGMLFTFAGGTAAGTWTLQVVDGASTDTGTLNSWGLHITCL